MILRPEHISPVAEMAGEDFNQEVLMRVFERRCKEFCAEYERAYSEATGLDEYYFDLVIEPRTEK